MKIDLEDVSKGIIDANLEEDANLSFRDIEKEYQLEELKIKKLETELRKEHLENKKQDRIERKEFADKLFTFLIGFLICVLLVVLLDGFKFICFELTDTVLLAILTTTAANIIGIFVFVVKYLFNTNLSTKNK